MQVAYKLENVSQKNYQNASVTRKAAGLSQEEQGRMVIEARDSARKLALRILASYRFRMDSEELQSLVDLSLCEAAKRFRTGAGASFITFAFYYIKGNLIRAIDTAARHSKSMTVCGEHQGSEENESVDEDPAAQLEKKQFNSTISGVLGELPSLQREIIENIFFKDLNTTMVAKKMRLSRGHVSRLKSAALRAIQEKLGCARLAA